tara:strand:- start:184 stop:381 length:198 start_codon:yes stop_codon:yes gene_type:complete
MKNTTEPQTIIINQPVLDQRFDRASKIGKAMARLIILKTMLDYDDTATIKTYIDDIYNQLDKIKL